MLIALTLLAGHVPSQQPVFRAGVAYVSVDAVVTDRDDKPIGDLTKEDFDIVERGRAQTISDFQFISVPIPARSFDTSVPLSELTASRYVLEISARLRAAGPLSGRYRSRDTPPVYESRTQGPQDQGPRTQDQGPPVKTRA